MPRVEAPLSGIHTRRGLLRVLTMGVVAAGADVATGGRVTKALISAVTTPRVSAASGSKEPELASTPAATSKQRVLEAKPAATPNPERKATFGEALVSSNPLIFTYPDSNGQPIDHSWSIDNLRPGVSPNDSDRRVGTIDDVNRKTGELLNNIQSYTALWEETRRGPGVSVVIAGQLADISTGRGYLAEEVVVNNVHYVGVGYIPELNKPNDYAARQLFRLNISGTFGDATESFSLGQDNQSRFVKLKKKRSLDPKDDGDWILRLDNSGNPVGDWSRPTVVEPIRNKSFIPDVSTGANKN